MQFLEHGLRYAFPVEQGALSRGIPTAYAAEPLRSAIQQGSDPPPVLAVCRRDGAGVFACSTLQARRSGCFG
jgi:hypothetical protein